MPVKIATAEREAMRARYDAAMQAGNVERDYDRALVLLRGIERDMARKPSAYTAAQHETIALAIRRVMAAGGTVRQGDVPFAVDTSPDPEPARVPVDVPQEWLAAIVPLADPFRPAPVWPWIVGGMVVVGIGLGVWEFSRR